MTAALDYRIGQVQTTVFVKKFLSAIEKRGLSLTDLVPDRSLGTTSSSRVLCGIFQNTARVITVGLSLRIVNNLSFTLVIYSILFLQLTSRFSRAAKRWLEAFVRPRTHCAICWQLFAPPD